MGWLTDFIKSLTVYIGAFFSGVFAEKYHDQKEQIKTDKKRDQIDAEPSPSKSSILDRMRNKKL